MSDEYYWVTLLWAGGHNDLREVWKLTCGKSEPYAFGFLAKGGLKRPGWFISRDAVCIHVIAELPTRTSVADAKSIAKTILLSGAQQ
jgi:hypothetical protein